MPAATAQETGPQPVEIGGYSFGGGMALAYAAQDPRELLHHQDLIGLRENAAKLADRRLLLPGGLDDPSVTVEHHLLPFYRALRQVGAMDVTFRVYQDDHSFSRSREQLAQEVRDWFLRRGASPETPREENLDLLNRRLRDFSAYRGQW